MKARSVNEKTTFGGVAQARARRNLEGVQATPDRWSSISGCRRAQDHFDLRWKNRRVAR